jgi:hypothetical protein
MLGS